MASFDTGMTGIKYLRASFCLRSHFAYFDITIEDEYLIPMGNYNSMRDVVDDATRSGTQILTFKSTRAVPIYSFME
jgi:hypothetical protein